MGGTLHPPSDIYVRSFLYLLYTLIKLYYTKTLSDQALSLAPDWTPPPEAKNPGVFHGSATTFQYYLRVLQFTSLKQQSRG